MVGTKAASPRLAVQPQQPAWLPGKQDLATYIQRKEACTAWALAQLASDGGLDRLRQQRRREHTCRRAWQAAALIPLLLALGLEGLAVSQGTDGVRSGVTKQWDRWTRNPLGNQLSSAASPPANSAPETALPGNRQSPAAAPAGHQAGVSVGSTTADRQAEGFAGSSSEGRHGPAGAANSSLAADLQDSLAATNTNASATSPRDQPQLHDGSIAASERVAAGGPSSSILLNAQHSPSPTGSLDAERMPGRLPNASYLPPGDFTSPALDPASSAQPTHGNSGTGDRSKGSPAQQAEHTQQADTGGSARCTSAAVATQLLLELQACKADWQATSQQLQELKAHQPPSFATPAAFVQGIMCVTFGCANVALLCLLAAAKQRMDHLKALAEPSQHSAAHPAAAVTVKADAASQSATSPQIRTAQRLTAQPSMQRIQTQAEPQMFADVTAADSPHSVDSSSYADKENRPGPQPVRTSAGKRSTKLQFPHPVGAGQGGLAGFGATASERVLAGVSAALELAGQASAAAMGAETIDLDDTEAASPLSVTAVSIDETPVGEELLLGAAGELASAAQQQAQLEDLLAELEEANQAGSELQQRLQQAEQQLCTLQEHLTESDTALVEAGEQLAQQLEAKRLLQSEVSLQCVQLEQLGQQLQQLLQLQGAAEQAVGVGQQLMQPSQITAGACQQSMASHPCTASELPPGVLRTTVEQPESSPLKKRIRLGGQGGLMDSARLPGTFLPRDVFALSSSNDSAGCGSGGSSPSAAQRAAADATSSMPAMPTALNAVLAYGFPACDASSTQGRNTTVAQDGLLHATAVSDAELSSEIHRLAAALQAAQHDAQTSQNALISAEIQISVLTGQLHSQPDASALSSRAAQLQADLRQLAMQKGAAETVLNETAVQLRDAQTQLQEARLHAEKADSQHNLTQAKAAARQHELEGQLSHQEQQNRELQVKFNAALKEVSEAIAVAKGLKGAHQAAASEAGMLREQLSAVHAQRDSHQGSLEAARLEATARQEQLERSQAELFTLQAVASNERHKLAEAEQRAARAGSQLTEVQAQVAQLQEQLQEDAMQAAEAADRLAEAERQLEASREDAQALREQLQSLRAVLDEELGEMRFTRRELGEADADAAQLEAELATQQEANRVLAGRLVDVQTLQAQLAAAQAEILALRDELHLREQEIHELWEQISEASDLGLQASPAAAAEASQHGSQRAQQEAAAAALGGSPGQSGVSDSWAGPLEPIAEPEQDSLMSESSRESDVSEASIGSQAVHSVSAGSSPDSSSAGQSVGVPSGTPLSRLVDEAAPGTPPSRLDDEAAPGTPSSRLDDDSASGTPPARLDDGAAAGESPAAHTAVGRGSVPPVTPMVASHAESAGPSRAGPASVQAGLNTSPVTCATRVGGDPTSAAPPAPCGPGSAACEGEHTPLNTAVTASVPAPASALQTAPATRSAAATEPLSSAVSPRRSSFHTPAPAILQTPPPTAAGGLLTACTPAQPPCTPVTGSLAQQHCGQHGSGSVVGTPLSPYSLTPTSARRAAAIAANYEALRAASATPATDADFLPAASDEDLP